MEILLVESDTYFMSALLGAQGKVEREQPGAEKHLWSGEGDHAIGRYSEIQFQSDLRGLLKARQFYTSYIHLWILIIFYLEKDGTGARSCQSMNFMTAHGSSVLFCAMTNWPLAQLDMLFSI